MKSPLFHISLTCIITLIFTTNLNTTFAQARGNGSYESPTIYIGAGVGINAPGGIAGIYFEAPINHRLSIGGAAGLGTWGTKLTGTLLMNTRPNGLKSSIGLGFSYASGLENVEMGLVLHPSEEKFVIMDLYKAYAVNLVYNYSWKIGRKCKLALQTGYSVGLSSNNYKLISDEGRELNDQSKNALRILSPGGLILGVAFYFGL